MTTASTLRVRAAAPGDLPPVLALLRAADLPEHGVAQGLEDFIVAEAEGRIVGAAGLERHGAYRLLRSVAVDPAWRGSGAGTVLVERLLDQADRAQVPAVYLLTTTAERYFPRFGFAPAAREEVVAEIRASGEFRGVCPASAAVMVRHLPNPGPPTGPDDTRPASR
jgi:amino-acid N-acetyltransferase